MLNRVFRIAELRDCPWFRVTRPELFDFVTPGEVFELVTPGEDPGSIALARHGSRLKAGMTVKRASGTTGK
jgi:hypothetical protein